jgi:hypothetical protein
MKIKGISPLKGIKKWALEGALNGVALSTALQAHVYGQTRAILLTSDLRPGGKILELEGPGVTRRLI